jgi:hypothetical protein
MTSLTVEDAIPAKASASPVRASAPVPVEPDPTTATCPTISAVNDGTEAMFQPEKPALFGVSGVLGSTEAVRTRAPRAPVMAKGRTQRHEGS